MDHEPSISHKRPRNDAPDTPQEGAAPAKRHRDADTRPRKGRRPSPFDAVVRPCRGLDRYEQLNYVDEGTFGTVYRARDRTTGEIVALKKIKFSDATGSQEGFPVISLREIKVLLDMHHPNIVEAREVVIGDDLDSVFLVLEFLEHDLKMLMTQMTGFFLLSEVKCLLQQLIRGVHHLHSNCIIHRDIKTSNLLMNNQGILKICDFGLARFFTPNEEMTPNVVTPFYRSVELFLGEKKYTEAVDMWSVGCIFAELMQKKPLFQANSEIGILRQIFEIVGGPTEESWPGMRKLPFAKTITITPSECKLRNLFPPHELSDLGYDLLSRLLAPNPSKRITSLEALQHPFFQESPLPQHTSMMPTFPSRADGNYVRHSDVVEEYLSNAPKELEFGQGDAHTSFRLRI